LTKEFNMPGDFTALFGSTAILIVVLVCCGTVFSIAVTVGAIILARRFFGPNRKVLEEGLSGEATILQVRQTSVMINNQPQAALRLEVRVPGWEPYETEIKMVIPIVNVPQFQPGAVFPVKVDPNNRSKVVLDVYGRG
jgi:hypothetical protein